ncbi:MAG: hypothetical protein WCL17_04405 [Actinomycetota bacterium]
MNRLRLLLSTLVVASFFVASPVSATTAAPTWAAGTLSIPSNQGIASGQVTLLSCVSAGNCLAGGWYIDYANSVHTFLTREASQNWASASAVPDLSGGTNFEVNGLTCATTECAGVGSNSLGARIFRYNWNTQAVTSFSITTSDSSLDTAHSLLKDVACTSDGNCVTGGYVTLNTGASTQTLLVDSEVSGTWNDAQKVSLPVGAGTSPAINPGQIGCISSARCVYIGSFSTADGRARPFIAIRQDGTWQSAVSPAMPSNAAPQGSQTLSELSCVTNGTCTAVGAYHTTAGTLVPYSVTITSNSIGTGIQIPLPSNAAPAPKAFLFGFRGISCASVGNCSLGAQYSYQINGVKHFGGFLTSEVNGVWNTRAQSTFMQIPVGADSAGQFGGVVGVSCWSAGNCTGAVAYVDSSQRYQVGVVLETANLWGPVIPVAMPSGQPAGAAGGLYALACFSATTCSGVGSYQGSSKYLPFRLNSN